MNSLLAVVIAEGFVILSVEVSIIRLLMPYVGSGIEATSILITAILLPMAYGYAYGGKFLQENMTESVRKKLQHNFFVSLCFLTLALSYIVVDIFYQLMLNIGITQHLVITTLYSLLFITWPIFLLAQTLPLISYYLSDLNAQQATGRLLFVSTLGSFLGAILTTLVFMNWIGVNWTCWLIAAVIYGMLCCVSQVNETPPYVGAAICVIAAVFTQTSLMNQLGVMMQTPYSHITISELENSNDKILQINFSRSSMVSDTEKFPYIQFIEDHFIKPYDEKLNILVLGAGGFTLGSDDTFHHYDFVDIEKHLKDISEKYLLKRPLHPNVSFHPMPAVTFLREHQNKYDLNHYTIPAHMATYDFYELLKTRLNIGGRCVLNIIASPFIEDTFSRRIDNTVRAAFPYVIRSPLHYDQKLSNIIYSYLHQEQDNSIYTNNKTTSSLDKQ